MNNDVAEVPLSKEDALLVAELIEENKTHIKNVIFNTLGPTFSYLVNDTISELYLLLCKKIDVLKSHSIPKGWILVAAKRTALSMMAKHQMDLSTVPLVEAVSKGNDSDVCDTALYEIWMENNVPAKLIARLTKREQEVYIKIYVEGKKATEVAKELNVSASTIHNIHKNLRDKITNDVKNRNF